MMVEMKEYFLKNWKVELIAFLISVSAFFFMLTHNMVLIDEEFHLNSSADPRLFLFGSRYTNYLLGLIFWHGRIVPFWTDFLALIFMNLAAFLFGFIFFDEKNTALVRIIALAYFPTVPFCMGEMFAFSEIILQIAVSMFFTSLASVITLYICGLQSPGKVKMAVGCFGAVVLMVLALGSYQALICVYVTAIVGCCLGNIIKKEGFLRLMITGALISAVSTILYSLINRIIAMNIGSTDYLSGNYVGWKDGVGKAAFMTLANVVRVSFAVPYDGERVYGGIPICILSGLFIIYMIRRSVKEKDKKSRILTLLFALFFIMAPFTLFLLLGTYKTHGRVMLALSLAGMVEIIMVSDSISREWLKKAGAVLGILILILNVANMNIIYSSAYKGYKEDCRIAEEITGDLESKYPKYSKKAVVFVGEHEREVDISPVNVTLGASFFSWDGCDNHRVTAFMEHCGTIYKEPTVRQMRRAARKAKKMPCWPEEGSIKKSGKVIIVKLSKPTKLWYTTNHLK